MTTRPIVAAALAALMSMPPGCGRGTSSGADDPVVVANLGGGASTPPVAVSCPASAPDPIEPTPFEEAPETSTVGWTPGEFAVGSLGEATYTIPIQVPPGRRGHVPSLALTYSSHAGSGPMGPGFAIAGLSSIDRCPWTVAPVSPTEPVQQAVRYDDRDHFCLDGMRLIEIGQPSVGVVEYRTYPDTQQRVRAYYAGVPLTKGPRYFRVELPSGAVATYGAETDDQADAVGRTFTGVNMYWMRSRLLDNFGNEVEYEYESTMASNPAPVNPEQAGQYTSETRISEIRYQGGSGTNRVTFEYAPILPIERFIRPMHVNQPGNAAAREGMRLALAHRLRAIRTYAGDEAVFTYVVGYEGGRGSGNDIWGGRLSFVQQCTGQAAPFDEPVQEPLTTDGMHCLAPTRFEWSASLGATPELVDLGLDLSKLAGGTAFLARPEILVADVNGDGLDDVIAQGHPDSDHDSLELHCAFGRPYPIGAAVLDDFVKCGEITSPYTYAMKAADLNNDERDDLLLVRNEYDKTMASIHYLTMTGNALTFSYIDSGIPLQPVDASSDPYVQSFHSWDFLVGDFNGDGQDDLITCDQPAPPGTAAGEPFAPGIAMYHRNDNGTFAAAESFALANPCNALRWYSTALDLDHDTKDELVDFSGEFFEAGHGSDGYVANDVARVYTRRGTGQWESTQDDRFVSRYSMQEHCPESTPTACYTLPDRSGGPPLFADINGDGVLDAVQTSNRRGCRKYQLEDLSPTFVEAIFGQAEPPEYVLRCISDVVTQYGDSPLQGPPALELLGSLPQGVGTPGGSPVPVGPGHVYQATTFEISPDADVDAHGTLMGHQPVAFHYDSDHLADLLVPAYPFWKVLRSTGRVADPYEIIDTPLPYNGRGLHSLDLSRFGRNAFLFVDLDHRLKLFDFDHPFERITSIHDGRETRTPSGDLVPSVWISYMPMVDHTLTTLAPATHNYASGPLAVGSYPVTTVNGSMQVVRWYRTPDGGDFSTQRDIAMFYQGYRYDRRGKRALGFAAIGAIDRQTFSGTWTEYDNDAPNPLPGHSDYPGSGVPKTTWTWTWPRPGESQLLVTRTERSYAVVPTAPGTYFQYPKWTHVKSVEAEIAPSWEAPMGEGIVDWWPGVMYFVWSEPSAETLFEWIHTISSVDSFGNILAEELATPGLPDETMSASHTYKDVVNDATWHLGRRGVTQLWSTAGPATATRRFESWYESHGARWRATIGTLAEPASYSDTRWEFDAHGNPVRVQSGNGHGDLRSACVTMDGYGVFPVLARNGLGHESRMAYDALFGSLLVAEDPNGATVQHQYDAFGRLYRSRDVFGNEETIERTAVRQPSAMCIAAIGSCEVTEVRSTTGSWTQHIADALGRPVATRSRGPDIDTCAGAVCEANGLVTARVERDARGRVIASKGPYLEAGPIVPTTTFEYDAAGRIVKMVSPGAYAIMTTYTGNIVSVDDGDAAPWTYERDVKGRITWREDKNGSKLTYTYGPFDQVIVSSLEHPDDGSEVSRYHRDDYGRVVEIEDPDTGLTEVTYDGFDQVREVTDAAGRIVVHQYDGLGRIQQLVEKESWLDAGQVTSRTYDSSPNGIGQLATTLSGDDVAQTFEYHAFGLLKRVSTQIPGSATPYSISADYDTYGRLDKLTYPDSGLGSSFYVRYHYDSTGALDHISRWANADEPLEVSWEVPLWSPVVMDVSGKVREEWFANGATSVRTYHPLTGDLQTISTSSGGNEIQSLLYDWNPRGELASRTDWLQGGGAGVTEGFEYDVLGRLVKTRIVDGPAPTDWSAVPVAQEVVYRANGNIQMKSDVGVFAYDDPSHPHAVTSVLGPEGLRNFGYDVVGNQDARPEGTISYNLRNLPRVYTVAGSALPVVFSYDAQGSRVRKWSELGETISIGELYQRDKEYVPGNETVTHTYRVYGPYGLIASVEHVVDPAGAGTFTENVGYIHRDYLGSVTVATDESGAVLHDSQQDYDAWGLRRDPDWLAQGPEPAPSSAPGFTGKLFDVEMNVFDLHARLYDPALGRMLGPDPIVSAGANLQGWNPYTYVLNNPLRFTDPDGMQPSPVNSPSSQHVLPPTVPAAPGEGGDSYAVRRVPDADSDSPVSLVLVPGLFSPKDGWLSNAAQQQLLALPQGSSTSAVSTVSAGSASSASGHAMTVFPGLPVRTPPDDGKLVILEELEGIYDGDYEIQDKDVAGDGLAQILDLVRSYPGRALVLKAHGGPGSMMLGASLTIGLSAADLDEQRWREVGRHVTEIRLNGCRFNENGEGLATMRALAACTCVPVTASPYVQHLTGRDLLGSTTTVYPDGSGFTTRGSSVTDAYLQWRGGDRSSWFRLIPAPEWAPF